MTDISNNAFAIFLFRFFLGVMGVGSKDNPLRYVNHAVLIVLVDIYDIVQQLILFLIVSDFDTLSVVGMNLIHTVNYVTTWMIMYRNRDIFRLIFKTVQAGIYEYPSTMRQYQPKHRLQSTTLMIFFLVVHISYLIILFVPLIYYLFGDRSPTTGNLMYPAWYPWQVTTETSYYLTYLHQVLIAYIITPFMPANIVFLMYFVLVVHDQNAVLHSVMTNMMTDQRHAEVERFGTKNIDAEAYPRMEVTQQTDGDRLLYDHLIECAKHHCALVRLIKFFVRCYKWVFACNLLYSTVIFALNCYLLIAVDFYLPKFTQRVCELLLMFPYFFAYCYIGEVFKEANRNPAFMSQCQNGVIKPAESIYMTIYCRLQFFRFHRNLILKNHRTLCNENDTFKRSLYEFNWHNKSVKLQKLILLLLTQTSTEVNLKYSANMVASYGLFASVMRASYTYANVLLNLHR